MPEPTKKPEQAGAGADAAAETAAAVTADDLELIPESLEDETKGDDEIWAEIDEEEIAAANGEDLAGDKPAVSADAAAGSAASAEDQLDAGIDAGKKTDEAAGTAAKPGKDDEGTQDAGDAAAAGAAASKLWDGASEGQRDAFNASQAQIKKLEQSERSQRGRVSSMQRQINDITQQIDAGAGKTAPPDKSGDDAGAEGAATNEFLDSKDWKDFEGEYPEVAGPLGKLVSGLKTEVTGLTKQLDAIGSDRRQDAVDEQEALLEEDHADWQDAAADDGFGPWLEDQPRHIREAAVRNAKEIVDAREAADVIGRFKAFRLEQSDDSAGLGDAGDEAGNQETVTDLSEKRKRQLESSAGARPTGASAATGIPEEGDEKAIWDAFDKAEARAARQA